MDLSEDLPLKQQEDDVQTNIHPFEAISPADSNGITNRFSSQNKFIRSQRDGNDFKPDKVLDKQGNVFTSSGDLVAMSMASLNEKDIEEMDTDNENRGYNIGLKLNIPNFNMLSDDFDDDFYETETLNSTPYMCPNSNFLNNNTKSCSYAPPNPFGENPTTNNSLFFADGFRSVDFVLAWKIDISESVEKTNQEKRDVYEMNLLNEGLEIERESFEEDLNFVKIHAPLEVLRRYSEILKLRMPMKECLCKVHNNARLINKPSSSRFRPEKIPGYQDVKNTTTTVFSLMKGMWALVKRKIMVDENHFPIRTQPFTAVYSRDKEYLFDLQQNCFFTAAIRSRIVQFILDRKRFSVGLNDDFAFGIDRLISDEVYLAAYPLHDGEIHVPGSMRHLLYTQWASVTKWYRHQPLDYIKEYFGVKIGLYFAWLGYYTYMLLLASVVGVVCFVYSYLTMDTNIPSKDICSKEMDIKMCPLCDKWCDYWELKETCLHSRITYLVDNPTTVFFAIFMSFWATLFLEQWKRYSAEITHRWDLTGFDVYDEHPRPQYLARLSHVKKVRINYVTNTQEPHPPFWRMKLPATVFSFSVILLLVLLAIVAVVAVVLYRISIFAALSFKSEVVIFTTASAASINLVLIFAFNYMYTYLAEYLTELELLRTQTEFDDSLTLKIYLLQFVNYYASIFYVAFFKGKFVGRPGAYNRLFDFRQEECGFGGCLLELCIQLAIIMIGKQAMNTILEMLIPKFWKWVNSVRVRYLNRTKNISFKGKDERWLRDLKLVEWGSRSLFPEYLEMVLQYGFVTIFVSAFPLAPFFALLNNIFEMRLDANKLLRFHRRPVSQRVPNIGVWYRILDSVSKLSVITNGFIIAFTSDFIPRLIYRIQGDGTLKGYVEFSLSLYQIPHSNYNEGPVNSAYNVTQCRYADYREPPGSANEYERTTMYWLIFAARLAFVVLFENIVALVMIVVRWCIPDMPIELRDKIRREAYITNEIIIKQETMRARAERAVSEQPPEEIESDANNHFIRMEKLMSGNLSASQLDLVMHGPNDPTAPSHCAPDKYKRKKNNSFISAERDTINDEQKTDTGPVSV